MIARVRRQRFVATSIALATAAGLLIAEAAVRVRRAQPVTAARSTAVPVTRDDQPRHGQALFGKNPGAFRVLALGDSFTWGVGVTADDAWPARLNRHLSQRAGGRRIEVINGGQPGTNTAEQFMLLCERYLAAEPDLVLLGICLNDPEPSGPQRAQLRKQRDKAANIGALSRSSALAALLTERLERVRLKRAYSRYYDHLFSPDQPGWPEFLAGLDDVQRELAQRSIPFLAVVFPLFDSTLDEHYPWQHCHDRLSAVLTSFDIEHIDLLGTFRGMEARRLTVEPLHDPHPNEIAHRIAAERIEDELFQRRLLPLSRVLLRTPDLVPPRIR